MVGADTLQEMPATGIHLVKVPRGTVAKKAARYRANPNVEYAHPDYYRVLIIPDEGDDPGPDAGGIVTGRGYFEEQWGLNNTGQQHTSFSSFSGPGDHRVSMMAPGVDILSINPVEDCIFLAEVLGFPFDPLSEGCLSWKSGTSMASPHVAGAAPESPCRAEYC